MTYFGFLLRFIVAANAALWVARAALRRVGREGWLARVVRRSPLRMTGYFAVLGAVILLYTTPWDGALIHLGVWAYARQRVWGLTLDGVPWEEILFYLLQSALVAQCFDLATAFRSRTAWARRQTPTRQLAYLPVIALWMGFGFVMLGSVYVLLNRWTHLTYLAMLVPWILLPLAVQSSYGFDGIAAKAGPVAISTVAPALYLSICDGIAIHSGIWFFHSERITDLRLGDVPIEEILFFSGSSLIVATSLAVIASRRSEQWLRDRRAGR
ncbi:lycopene cyclase domain-containing protein [Alicyclobacillus mali]|uniref:Lycopene cyclase domain-containing protein n=1 Tax=Alicyclobacillus mali (ex Roth et al. 2021) TaxID=1123961 RepID=A0ABS0EZT6_9BACL|nr:lycopene cyclase domain-containing protein [Alicyclobacillus mali (ex Roth et al. 2021)]MBF8376553.1 lycopene cyclase domain-containing protein [Alicyclobacillus mali (ex Roth et al. 2021)]